MRSHPGRGSEEAGRSVGAAGQVVARHGAKARSLMAKDGLNADDAAKVLGVSRLTMFRGLKAARDHDELLHAE